MDVRVHVEDRNQSANHTANQSANQGVHQDATGYATGRSPPPFMTSTSSGRPSVGTTGAPHGSMSMSPLYDQQLVLPPEEAPETAVEAQRRAIIMDPASYAGLGDFHLNLARSTITPTATLSSSSSSNHHHLSPSNHYNHHDNNHPHHHHQPTPTQQHLNMAKGYYEEAQRASSHKHGHIHPTTLGFGVRISEITSLEQLHVSQYYYEELLKSSVDELGPDHPTVIDYARRLLEINESIRHTSNNEGINHDNNNHDNNNNIEVSSRGSPDTLLLSVISRSRTSSQPPFPQSPPK